MAYKAPCCGGSGHYSGLPQIPLTITPVCVGTHKHCFTLMACFQSGVWFCQTHIKVERVMSSLEECCVVARPRDRYLRQTCWCGNAYLQLWARLKTSSSSCDVSCDGKGSCSAIWGHSLYTMHSLASTSPCHLYWGVRETGPSMGDRPEDRGPPVAVTL